MNFIVSQRNLVFIISIPVKFHIEGMNLFNAFIFMVIREQSQIGLDTVDTLRKETIPA